PALPMTLVFERCRVEYLQAIGAAARSADPEPWLSFLHRAAIDAVLALNEVRPRLADLRDELVEALGRSLSESDAKRLAVAILEEPVAHEPALQRRTRLAPKKIAAALDRLAGHAFVRRMALGQG